MDVSKQIASAFTIHMLNLLLAFLLAMDTPVDECVWYFINLSIDTLLGTFICYGLVLLVDKISHKKNLKYLRTGMYYEKSIVNDKPKYKFFPKMYIAQLVTWIIIVIIVIMLFIKISPKYCFLGYQNFLHLILH
jgi:hypothetical protein